ncbi:HdeD family acid-resistance protein [Amycolatopsis anabasis]|uniref:HdeD family acid-resistance protein n=1 Tax=Amycolatopsis anabasis TaxID=1840409 RepID=UPI00131AB040|nr:HdeD family acid-resistance protein [Amycolatopsis anabasis]
MSATEQTPSSYTVVLSVPDIARMMLIRGVVAVLFGLLALIWPELTTLALALVFGVYALIDGIGLIIAAFRGHAGMPRWLLALGGVVGVAAGLLTLFWPGITVLILAIMVGAWAVVTGVAEVVAAIRLRKVITGEALIAVIGVLSIIAGVLILFQPIAGAIGIAVVIGVYALLYGILLVVAWFQLRKAARRLTGAGTDAPSGTR